MTPNKEKESWNYLLIKKTALLKRITSKHDFYCWNCRHSFITKNKRKSHEKVCKNKGWPSQKDSILQFHQYMILDKISQITYADLESLIKRIDICANNNNKTKIGENISCRYSMSTIWAFDNGEDCMKKLHSSLR